MTKWGGFACGPRGHHRADFPLRILDDDTIDESFHQLSALGKRQGVECGMQTLTKRRDSLGPGSHIDRLLGLGIELAQVLREARLCLGHLLALPLDLCPFDALREGHIEPARVLTFARREDITQRVTARGQGLGQPCAHRRACQCMGDEGRLPQHPAEVLPDQCIQGVCGCIARRAAVAPDCAQRIRAPLTDVRVRAGRERPTGTRQPTLGPADEATEEGRMRRLVAPCHRHSALQAKLHSCEGLLAHDGRHGHGNPCVHGGGWLTLAGANRRHGRCAPARWDGLAASTIRHPRRGG